MQNLLAMYGHSRFSAPIYSWITVGWASGECQLTSRKKQSIAEFLLSVFLAEVGPGAAIPKSCTSTDHGLPTTGCDSGSAVTITRGLRRAMIQ
jgi:hypothetical protein